MKRTVKIYPYPLERSAFEKATSIATHCGSSIDFKGHVRNKEAGSQIEGIHYQAFEEMAQFQFSLILDKIESTWPIDEVIVHHVVGKVPVGEASIWVRIISGHRAEGFEAIQYLLSQMKLKVPIWKSPIECQR